MGRLDQLNSERAGSEFRAYADFISDSEFLKKEPPKAPTPNGKYRPAQARLLTLDICRLDDRPPFLDLGLVKRAERLRDLLIARENLLADIGEL